MVRRTLEARDGGTELSNFELLPFVGEQLALKHNTPEVAELLPLSRSILLVGRSITNDCFRYHSCSRQPTHACLRMRIVYAYVRVYDCMRAGNSLG